MAPNALQSGFIPWASYVDAKAAIEGGWSSETDKRFGGLGHRPPLSETCNRRSFRRSRFEYGQQPGNFQGLSQVRA
jgi:hypothetical protein